MKEIFNKNGSRMLACLSMLTFLFSCSSMKESYVLNPELPVIKKDWKGNLMQGKQFCNTHNDEKYSFWEIMKWQLSKNPQKDEKKTDTFRLKVIPNKHFISAKDDMIVWLGHASFFIRLGGKTFITDPIFYNAIFLKRLAGLPCNVDEIKGIDYLLLSHNHRDHVDLKSITQLAGNNPEMKGLLPLKLGKVVDSEVKNIQEAGWFQQFKTNSSVKVFLMPAKHWSKRGLFDTKKTLWGSYIIQANGKTLFFAGDCAYNEENIKEIRDCFPNIDYALIPIGAYKPPYIMKRAHLSPSEGVDFFNLLGAKTMIPMHYATFDLSDEPIGEPYREIKRLESEGKINGNLKTLDLGEEFTF